MSEFWRYFFIGYGSLLDFAGLSLEREHGRVRGKSDAEALREDWAAAARDLQAAHDELFGSQHRPREETER